MTDVVKLPIRPDGGLNSLDMDSGRYRWYLSWWPGDDTICLDGEFSVGELRAIADYVERIKSITTS